MLKTLTQTEEECVAKASKPPDDAKETTKNEANFLATIRIESNNGAKAGRKKTLPLPTVFYSTRKRKLLLNQNNNKAWHTGSVEILASLSIRKPSTAG